MTVERAVHLMVEAAWAQRTDDPFEGAVILRPKRYMKKRYAIGIDPGVETGIVEYDREAKQIRFKGTVDFWEAYQWFIHRDKGECFAVIECPKKTRLYERQDKEQGERRREKIAANAGGNAREAELLADGLERLGFEVRRVTPTRTKWTAKDLKQRTGITERTNQHVRDAISLVYGL